MRINKEQGEGVWEEKEGAHMLVRDLLCSFAQTCVRGISTNVGDILKKFSMY